VRKEKEKPEKAKAAPVERVNVRQSRTQLRSIMRADHPTIVTVRGRNAAVILPTGAKDWQHKWDYGLHTRNVRCDARAVLKVLDKE
jgi:hypothetical protein